MFSICELFSYAASWTQSDESTRFRWASRRFFRSIKVESTLNKFHPLDIETQFKDQLLKLVPALFETKNENFVKKVDGETLSALDLLQYFKVRRKR